jgi:selenocysteine-specific elongation factor
MPREELRRRVRWPDPVWQDALHQLQMDGVVQTQGLNVSLPGHRGGTGGRRDEVERVINVLQRDRYSPPSLHDLLIEARTDEPLVLALEEEGRIVRVTPTLYFSRESFDSLVAKTMELIQTHGSVSVASLRDTLGTSRKYTLALLEYLDSRRVTRRVGDVRIAGSQAIQC